MAHGRTRWTVSKTTDYLLGRLDKLVEQARAAGSEVTDERVEEIRAGMRARVDEKKDIYGAEPWGFQEIGRAWLVDDVKHDLGLPRDEGLQRQKHERLGLVQEDTPLED